MGGAQQACKWASVGLQVWHVEGKRGGLERCRDRGTHLAYSSSFWRRRMGPMRMMAQPKNTLVAMSRPPYANACVLRVSAKCIIRVPVGCHTSIAGDATLAKQGISLPQR